MQHIYDKPININNAGTKMSDTKQSYTDEHSVCSAVLKTREIMTEATPLLSPHSSALVEVTSQHGITKGLGTLAAAILVAGTMAGTGILALPGAVLKTGRNYSCKLCAPLVKL